MAPVPLLVDDSTSMAHRDAVGGGAIHTIMELGFPCFEHFFPDSASLAPCYVLKIGVQTDPDIFAILGAGEASGDTFSKMEMTIATNQLHICMLMPPSPICKQNSAAKSVGLCSINPLSRKSQQVSICFRDILFEKTGGETGIRTLGPREGTTVFETAPFDHSGTSPRSACC